MGEGEAGGWRLGCLGSTNNRSSRVATGVTALIERSESWNSPSPVLSQERHRRALKSRPPQRIRRGACKQKEWDHDSFWRQFSSRERTDRAGTAFLSGEAGKSRAADH